MHKSILLATMFAASLPVVAAQSSSSGAPQTITGLLMDAGCAAIAGNARPVGNGKAARTADRSERDAANNPGTNGPDKTAVKRSEDAASSTATAGPSQASATGTTGAAVNTAPPPHRDNLESVESGQTLGAAKPDRERARNAGSSATGPISVREKYKACIVTPDTTAFAIHTENRVYVLDQASNKMVQDQMRNEAFRASMSDRGGTPRFMTVTVVGTASGDTLAITSVRK